MIQFLYLLKASFKLFIFQRQPEYIGVFRALQILLESLWENFKMMCEMTEKGEGVCGQFRALMSHARRDVFDRLSSEH